MHAIAPLLWNVRWDLGTLDLAEITVQRLRTHGAAGLWRDTADLRVPRPDRRDGGGRRRPILSGFQRRVLGTLAANRSPQSHVAGGAALNRDRPRLTADIDLFHDFEAAVRGQALADVATLRVAGLKVSGPSGPPRRGLVEHVVRDGAEATLI